MMFCVCLTKQLSKYPALNRLDKQLPFPKSYVVVGVLAIFTFVRTNYYPQG